MSSEAPRIPPRFTDIASGEHILRIAEITLGPLARGAVIVLCDTGALERDSAEVMNGLAVHGFESLAVDLPGDDPELLAALLGRLGDRGWSTEQIGLIGYGSGGRRAVRAATRFDLGAVVSVPPGADGSPSSIRSPWLGLFGERDETLPPDAVDRLRTALERCPVHAELIGYPGVGHGIWRDSAATLAHVAAFDSWQRTIEWLTARVGPRRSPARNAATA